MLSKYTNNPLPWIQNYVSIQSPAVYLLMAHLCGSQRTAPGPEASASPGNLLDLHIVGPTPDVLNQNYWRWSPVTYVWPHSGDPNVCSNLRTTGIFQLRFTFFFSSCPHSRHHSPPPPRLSWLPTLITGVPTLMEKMNFGPISSKLCTTEETFPSKETS